MGQICTATSRLYVQSTIYDEFIERLREHTAQNTQIGDQFDEQTGHGPQISRVQQEKILAYVESGKSEGAHLLVGGGTGTSAQGFFVEPTIFTGVRNDMKIVREEIFGPFLAVQSFEMEDQAVEKANDSEYGLGAAVFTRDIVRGHRVADLIQAGMVWVSDCGALLTLSTAELSISTD